MTLDRNTWDDNQALVSKGAITDPIDSLSLYAANLVWDDFVERTDAMTASELDLSIWRRQSESAYSDWVNIARTVFDQEDTDTDGRLNYKEGMDFLRKQSISKTETATKNEFAFLTKLNEADDGTFLFSNFI